MRLLAILAVILLSCAFLHQEEHHSVHADSTENTKSAENAVSIHNRIDEPSSQVDDLSAQPRSQAANSATISDAMQETLGARRQVVSSHHLANSKAPKAKAESQALPAVPWVVDKAAGSGITPNCLDVAGQNGDIQVTLGVERVQNKSHYLGLLVSTDGGLEWAKHGPCLEGQQWLSLSRHGDTTFGIFIDHDDNLRAAQLSAPAHQWHTWPLPSSIANPERLIDAALFRQNEHGHQLSAWFRLPGNDIHLNSYIDGSWQQGQEIHVPAASNLFATINQADQVDQQHWRIHEGRVQIARGNGQWFDAPTQPIDIFGRIYQSHHVAMLAY